MKQITRALTDTDTQTPATDHRPQTPDTRTQTIHPCVQAGINRLVHNGTYATAFPLHDASFHLPREVDELRGGVLCAPKPEGQWGTCDPFMEWRGGDAL